MFKRFTAWGLALAFFMSAVSPALAQYGAPATSAGTSEVTSMKEKKTALKVERKEKAASLKAKKEELKKAREEKAAELKAKKEAAKKANAAKLRKAKRDALKKHLRAKLRLELMKARVKTKLCRNTATCKLTQKDEALVDAQADTAAEAEIPAATTEVPAEATTPAVTEGTTQE